jgi:hypothetical protein
VALGSSSRARAVWSDAFCAFKTQLEAFVGHLRTGESPVPFAKTLLCAKWTAIQQVAHNSEYIDGVWDFKESVV